MLNFTGTYTDQYQLTMAQVYFLQTQESQPAIFDYFFRKLPFENGYAIFAGLEDLLEALENLQFDNADIEFLRQQNFDPQFLEYLKNFRFNGTIYAFNEGDLVFPTSPILTVEANIIEAQIIETLILNLLNFQTLIATKACRMRQVAKNRQLIDFGLRRAQGPGGYYASRAAIIGGFDGTSNVRAGRDYEILVSGTMAHSFVQSYDNELSAFRDFAKIWPNKCVLLVDTYDTLKSGVPNAITVGKELEAHGHKLKGIRLDSGDLAILAKESRKMLDDAGLAYVKIAVSNQLDEKVIQQLLEQNAPIDIFGVGTKLVTGQPDAALDGVYKLAFANNQPRIKLSETIEKITLPCKKNVYRILDDKGDFLGTDIITLENEKDFDIIHYPFQSSEPFPIKGHQKECVLHKVMEKGKRLNKPKSLSEIAAYSQKRLTKLASEYKRFNSPKSYKIGLSTQLKNKRDQLIKEHKKS